MPTPIQHQPAQNRFATRVDGFDAMAEYRVANGVMTITHTLVAPELQGRGIAGELMHEALTHAKTHGWKVNPACSYAAVYMKRHPEWAELHV